LAAGAEPVAARGTPRRVHRVAEFTQAVDVVAHRSRRHAEPRGEFGAIPFGPGLEQREERKQPCGGIGHVSKFLSILGTKRAYINRTVGDMNTTTSTIDIRPFRVEISQAELDDLMERLARTRLPQPAPVDDWDAGTPNSYLREAIDAWRTTFDWRAEEARI